MPKLSAGHRLAIKKGIAKKNAGLPCNMLAKAMRVDPQLLRARFASRGFKVRGASLGALVGALTEKERSQHGARIRKLMQRTPDDTAPEAARPLPAVRSSDHTQEGSGALVPDVRLALIGLYRAARAIGPLRPDQQNKVSLGVAEAINALRGTPEYKHGDK
jgi:hypothetical protein